MQKQAGMPACFSDYGENRKSFTMKSRPVKRAAFYIFFYIVK
jgi:hypothetical protein